VTPSTTGSKKTIGVARRSIARHDQKTRAKRKQVGGNPPQTKGPPGRQKSFVQNKNDFKPQQTEKTFLKKKERGGGFPPTRKGD